MREGPAGALALIVATFALVGAGTAWNRSGGPVTEFLLTEREVPLPVALEADETLGALPLVLAHGVAVWERQVREPGADGPPPGPPWLDRAKLAELGFDVSLDPASAEAPERYGRAVPRLVHVALEHDGPAWREWMDARERAAGGDAERTVARLGRALRSRLWAVDASIDAASLRRRYPDPARHAIVRATVGARVVQTPGEPARLGGTLHLESAFLYLPPAARRALAPLRPAMTMSEFLEGRARRTLPPPAAREPRYAVSVAFGRGGEPWIRSLDTVPASGP